MAEIIFVVSYKSINNSRPMNYVQLKWISGEKPRRKSRKGKFRNDTVITTVDVGKNVLEVEEIGTMVWARDETVRKYIVTMSCRMGTRRNTKEGKTQRKMDE
jgi:hypothetical protein